MKAVIAVIAVAVALAAARSLDDDLTLFQDFQITYNRQYSPSEYPHKFSCFRKVLGLIDERNNRGKERHSVNQFADMCPEEFAAMYLGSHLPNNTKPFNRNPSQVLSPANPQVVVDWCTKGAVTPIKNQGMCGSCWAFSAVGNMEGVWFNAGHALVGLSEEEIVQCATNGNYGCNGGWMDNAFEWVVSNGGVDSESDYPYTSGGGNTGTCNTAKTKNNIAHISGHTDIASSEATMATYLAANGPISVAVDAVTWQTYSGGIMSNCNGQQLDHGVLAVGVDTTASTPYWIVKNSWGTSWGEAGYIQLEYGTNQCDITAKASSANK